MLSRTKHKLKAEESVNSAGLQKHMTNRQHSNDVGIDTENFIRFRSENVFGIYKVSWTAFEGEYIKWKESMVKSIKKMLIDLKESS